MAEPLPSDGYGPAVWEDYNNNWRKADTDWLQSRAILRYASLPGSGAVGQVVYDFASDRLNLRSKVNRWIPVVAAENLLTGPITSSSPSEGVGFTHKSSAGQGLVFAPDEIIAYQKLRTGASEVAIDATGVSIKTGAATALLNTNATGLASSVAITAPSFVGLINAPAGLSTVQDLSVSRDLSVGRNATITGTLGVTGLVSVNAMDITADPVSANRAARRSWVEGLVNAKLSQATADARYVLNTGDTISGTLNLTRAGEAPLIQFYNIAGTARFGYIEALSTSLLLASDAAAGMIRHIVGGTERLRVDNAGADLTGNLTVSGTAVVNGIFYGMSGRFGGNGGQMSLIDTTGGGNSAYMQFFGSGTTSAPGPRIGYVGFPTSTGLSLRNEIAAGAINLITNGAGDVNLTPGVGGEIGFSPGNTFQGKMSGAVFLWGKSASDLHNAGIEMYGAGSSAEGRIASSSATFGLYLHHVGAGDAANAAFIQFATGTSTVILSEARQNAARNGITIVNCTVSAPSDYRWKDDLGPITNAIDRVMQLRPKRLRWRSSGEEFEGFIAHEAQPIIPYLVTGEKDAVTDDGEIEGQGVNYGGETPLLTAAFQELVERVTALESAA